LINDTRKPGKLGHKLQKYEQIKDLAAMRHYEGWEHDCTSMLDLCKTHVLGAGKECPTVS